MINQSIFEILKRWFSTDLIHRKDKGSEARRMMLKDVIPVIGNLNIKEIQKSHIFEITDELLKRGVNRMAKVVFSLIRQMFRFAVLATCYKLIPQHRLARQALEDRI